MNQSYCYSFRFCCDPGFNDRREIASLRRFVREAQIDDVAVFCNVEELNTGHMTEEEQETIWLRLLCDVQAALAPRFYALTIRDETRPRRSLWAGAGDDTLRGLFLQALKAQYDAAADDTAGSRIALAARLGTAAMDGREDEA